MLRSVLLVYVFQLFVSKSSTFTTYPLQPVFRAPLRALQQSNADQEEVDQAALVVLATVPLAWGSFEPATRYLYSLDPVMPGSLFSVGYYAVAATVLGFLWRLISPSEPVPWRAGAELGAYLFVGNGIQVWGLRTVPSDRAALFLQLTTLIVPLLEVSIRQTKIDSRIWLSCCLALVGATTIGLDGEKLPFAAASFSGDGCILCAAVSYSLHCLRLEKFAKATSTPFPLAFGKAAVESALSVASVLLISTDIGPFSEAKTELVAFFSDIQSMEDSVLKTYVHGSSFAILWTGIVTIAYTISAQTYGQKSISPIIANIIYTAQPLWTIVIAYVLLGERLSIQSGIGGLLIFAAVVFCLPNADNNQTS